MGLNKGPEYASKAATSGSVGGGRTQADPDLARHEDAAGPGAGAVPREIGASTKSAATPWLCAS